MAKEWGEIIKNLRESRGWTQGQLAQRSGIPRSTIASWEPKEPKNSEKQQKKNPSPNPDNLVAIANAFEMPIEDLYKSAGFIAENQADYDITRPDKVREKYLAIEPVWIPILGAVPAGYPSLEEQQVEGYAFLSKEEIHGLKKDVYFLRIKGDSLIGDDIKSGDLVLIERNPLLVDGKIYIVRISENNEVVARHVFRENGHIRLVSSNGDYRVLNVDEAEILGRVVKSIRTKGH